jgi:stage III sporulation protein AE
MRIIAVFVLILTLLPMHVQASEITPPSPGELGEKYMPSETGSFSEGLWEIVQKGIHHLAPSIAEAASVCGKLIAMIVVLALVKVLWSGGRMLEVVGTVSVSCLLLNSSTTLVSLASETVRQLSDYGKLIVPMMASALAGEGGITTAAALYSGTVVFDTVLSSLITFVLTPMVFVYLVLSVGGQATGEKALTSLRDFVKWLMTWILKIILYVFTGYMAVTKVISGSTDAASLKAAKISISGMVPVVGGIISDTSEAILVSAQLVKNSLGVFGLLAIAAMWIEPFIKIGIQYLLLKATGSICSVFDLKGPVGIIKNFSVAMGYLLAMTAAVCIMLLVSIVCLMKGVA